jgi:4-amino-4-deoxy-L-arabinose transferase-like glycosyltransferase
MPRLKTKQKPVITPFSSLLRSLDPSSDTRTKGWGKPDRAAIAFIAVLFLLVLVPFLGRAFHIDDPLFLWVAGQVQTHPGNPFGFSVNWYGGNMPVWDITKNPPFTSYYIALVAFIFGWSEPVLHLAFVAASIAVGIGTYLLAVRLCEHPLLATLAGLLTPVFLVSSLTVMSDVLMLAFWVFAVYFWMKGIDETNRAALLLAGVLVAVSSLTKYFGMALIPLLLVYSAFRKRGLGGWVIYLVIPVAILALYQAATVHLYGRGLLLDAAAYATESKSDFAKFPIAKSYVNFAFTGACVATALLFIQQLWSRKVIIGGILVVILETILFFNLPSVGSFVMPTERTPHFLLALQLSIWGMVGISLIVLTTLDLYQHQDSDSLLLFLWIVGTSLFAGFINWTINGRSILPMTVPAGIILARRLEKRVKSSGGKGVPPTLGPLAAALVLAIAVSWGDTALADTARVGATRIYETFHPRQVWFQGHWGFQYYMEQLGAKAIDVNQFRPAVGDLVAIPATNTNLFPLPTQWPVRQVFEVPSGRWISTMNAGTGAGFYADIFGPLPYVIAPASPEQFAVFEITQ